MINVKGICPDFIFENEPKSINMKAIPLPPIREFEKKKAFKNAVVMAVIRIISKSLPEPYFSSRSGPTSSIIIKFPIRCDQFP